MGSLQLITSFQCSDVDLGICVVPSVDHQLPVLTPFYCSCSESMGDFMFLISLHQSPRCKRWNFCLSSGQSVLSEGFPERLVSDFREDTSLTTQLVLQDAVGAASAAQAFSVGYYIPLPSQHLLS